MLAAIFSGKLYPSPLTDKDEIACIDLNATRCKYLLSSLGFEPTFLQTQARQFYHLATDEVKEGCNVLANEPMETLHIESFYRSFPLALATLLVESFIPAHEG